MSFVGLFESPCNRVSWKRLSCEWYFFEHNQIPIWLNLHCFPLELTSKRNYLRIFLAFFLIVWKSLKNVASLNFSFTTVYKNVPSAPNVGSPAVPPSARNKLQKYNSNETQTGFECMTVIFIKRLLKTFRYLKRLSEKCDVLYHFEMWR